MGGRRPLNSVLSPVFMIIDYLIDTASLTNIFICKSHPALFLWPQISIPLWPQIAKPVLFQFAPVPGIISGLPQGLAPYLSPQVDFRMVMMVRMVIVMVMMVKMVMVILILIIYCCSGSALYSAFTAAYRALRPSATPWSHLQLHRNHHNNNCNNCTALMISNICGPPLIFTLRGSFCFKRAPHPERLPCPSHSWLGKTLLVKCLVYLGIARRGGSVKGCSYCLGTFLPIV